MKLFRNASLGDWVAVIILVGTIFAFSLSASFRASDAVAGVAGNKKLVDLTEKRIERLEDSMMVFTVSYQKDYKALNKTVSSTYSIVAQMAKQQGILIPEEGL